MSNATKRYLDLGGLTTYDSEIKDYIQDHCVEGSQSDWNVTDTTDPSYIKNKPTIPTKSFSKVYVQDPEAEEGYWIISADELQDRIKLNFENLSYAASLADRRITLQLTSENVTDALGYTPPTTDTTYQSKQAVEGGTDVSLVTTGEKYAWNNASSNHEIVSTTEPTEQSINDFWMKPFES